MNIEKQSNTKDRIVDDITIERSHLLDESQEVTEFLRRIKEEHPEQHYPNPALLEGYDPIQTLLFVGKSENVLAGILLGSEDQFGFNAKVLIVDPKYAITNIGAKLIQALQANYDNIRLTPQPLVWKKGKITARTDALTRYYEKLGFHDTGTGLMTWERNQPSAE